MEDAELVRGPHATLLLSRRQPANSVAAAKRSIPQDFYAELACFLCSESLTVVGIEYESPSPGHGAMAESG